MEVYNKNRDKNRNMHDEIREQNAKLKDATLKEKLSYFKEYYLKTTLAALAGIVFVISIIYTIATAPEDTAFAALFYNDTGDSSSTALIDEYIAHMGIDTSKHDAYIDATMNYSSDGNGGGYEDYAGLQKTMALIASNELDIIVGDQDAFDYFARSDCFSNLSEILPEDLYQQFSDQIYYFTNEETGETIPMGIYVTDSPKLNENYYYVNKEPILGFLINSDSLDNALEFLRFIYMD